MMVEPSLILLAPWGAVSISPCCRLQVQDVELDYVNPAVITHTDTDFGHRHRHNQHPPSSAQHLAHAHRIHRTRTASLCAQHT